MRFTTQDLRELPEVNFDFEKSVVEELSKPTSKYCFAKEVDHNYVTIKERKDLKKETDYIEATSSEVQDYLDNDETLISLIQGWGGLDFYQEHIVYDTDPNGYNDSRDGNEMLSIVKIGDTAFGCVWTYSSWDSAELDKWFKLPTNEFELVYETPTPIKIKV
jgi:hypothetical protein